MPSPDAARATSSTESRIAWWRASAPARSPILARESSEAGNRAEHQPPLRPEAPKPTVSASSTAIRSVGVGLGEVVGGPEPGEAGADDRDVDLGVAAQWGVRRGRRSRVVPERVQRTPHEYVCLRSVRYMKVSVRRTPSMRRIFSEISCSSRSSLSHTTSARMS